MKKNQKEFEREMEYDERVEKELDEWNKLRMERMQKENWDNSSLIEKISKKVDNLLNAFREQPSNRNKNKIK